MLQRPLRVLGKWAIAPPMSALDHVWHRSAGAVALLVAFAVLLGSLCPRGWFVCVDGETIALVGEHHADGHHTNAHHGEHDCGQTNCGDKDCLDFALSLVLDDQTVAPVNWGVLPPGFVLASLPDLTAAVASSPRLWCADIHDPPPLPFVSQIRLLV